MEYLHLTDPDRLGSILASGLLVGSERPGFAPCAWFDEVYGERPVFLSARDVHLIERGLFRTRPALSESLREGRLALLAVDVSGLPLAVDLPHFVSHRGGSVVEDRGLRFKGNVWPALEPFLDDAYPRCLPFQALLGPATAAAGKIAQSFASLSSIPSERLRLLDCGQAQLVARIGFDPATGGLDLDPEIPATSYLEIDDALWAGSEVDLSFLDAKLKPGALLSLAGELYEVASADVCSRNCWANANRVLDLDLLAEGERLRTRTLFSCRALMKARLVSPAPELPDALPLPALA